MPHPPGAGSRLPRRGADARAPPDLDLAGTQMVAERAALGLMLEQGGQHSPGYARDARTYARTAQFAC